MKVTLAGYNIDKSLIEQIPNEKLATPETICAAYARISRSKKTVIELREESLEEVEQARNSNENIIFEMGHSSIAEHAVFNFDIIGISRYLIEFIERSRLASFTEKSQRYVTLQGDYVLPTEIKGTELEAEFKEIINNQNTLYEKLYAAAKENLENSYYKGSRKELFGKAKEDARYVLALATQTQLGMTINARSIANLLRRLDRTDLDEAQELKNLIETQVKEIAPSLIRYTISDDYEKKMCNCLPDIEHIVYSDKLELLGNTISLENSILSSMYFEKYGYDAQLIMLHVQRLTKEEKADIFEKIFTCMKSYHAAPRAFEIVYFTFQMSISSSCFGQLKRHRMSTILRSDYSPDKGYIIPPLIRELNMDSEIEQLMQQVHLFYEKLEQFKQGLGNYILTNGHKLNVIFKANLRELYHVARLRSDKHAQWEINELSKKIEAIIKRKMPNAAKYMMGKDEFKKMDVER